MFLLSKNKIFKATALLTLAGIISRIFGFYYRILLSKLIGSTGVGLIQMCLPLATFAFALCCSGFTTAISRFIAKDSNQKWFRLGVQLSLLASTITALLIYKNSSFLASVLFSDERCISILKIISLSLPLTALHNCINSFYYSKTNTIVPATSQLLEQSIRIGSIYVFLYYCKNNITLSEAILGNVFGELAACIYCISSTKITLKKIHIHYLNLTYNFHDLKTFLLFSIPLNTSQTLLRLLESGEAILIPAALSDFGLTKDIAIGTLGIVAGMVIPLISFPCAAVNSFSVLLLPKISKEYKNSDNNATKSTVKKTTEICINLGIFAIFLFLNYGAKIGSLLFSEDLVYAYTLILCWLCPFLYLKISLSSVLNALGYTTYSCLISIIGISIRLLSILTLIPLIGIKGYLFGLLGSNIFISLCFLLKLYKELGITPTPVKSIIYPIIRALASVLIVKDIFIIICGITKTAEGIILLLFEAILTCIIYTIISVKLYKLIK